MVNPAAIDEKLNQVRKSEELRLLGVRTVRFRGDEDLIFHRDQPYPPGARIRYLNGLRCTAYDFQNAALDRRIYFSVGGGFIVEDGEAADALAIAPIGSAKADLPHAFGNAAELLEMTEQSGITAN